MGPLNDLELLSRLGIDGILLGAIFALWKKLDQRENTLKEDYEKHIAKYEALLERFIRAME